MPIAAYYGRSLAPTFFCAIAGCNCNSDNDALFGKPCFGRETLLCLWFCEKSLALRSNAYLICNLELCFSV
jgi:hypothetical protein